MKKHYAIVWTRRHDIVVKSLLMVFVKSFQETSAWRKTPPDHDIRRWEFPDWSERFFFFARRKAVRLTFRWNATVNIISKTFTDRWQVLIYIYTVYFCLQVMYPNAVECFWLLVCLSTMKNKHSILSEETPLFILKFSRHNNFTSCNKITSRAFPMPMFGNFVSKFTCAVDTESENLLHTYHGVSRLGELFLV